MSIYRAVENVGLKKFLPLFGFSAAMGFLEAIVVVYLRELFYPSGFSFPLTPIPENILFAEILREVCTIAMLIAVALVAAKGIYQRFSVFLFAFGVWDIFYYVALKFLLGWPPSLFTWDILFLIPVAWVAPVLAPAICALTMIALALLIARLMNTYGMVRTGIPAWTFMSFGALVVFLTFIWDYSAIILRGGFLPGFLSLGTNPKFQEAVSGFVPSGYNWYAFLLGEAAMLLGMWRIHVNTRNAVNEARPLFSPSLKREA